MKVGGGVGVGVGVTLGVGVMVGVGVTVGVGVGVVEPPTKNDALVTQTCAGSTGSLGLQGSGSARNGTPTGGHAASATSVPPQTHTWVSYASSVRSAFA